MKQTILVADDDSQIRQILRLYLENAGFTVLDAENGVAALLLFQQSHPDLVILDIMMPVLDGLETARQIRNLAATPIILLTARGAVDDRVRGLDDGADDYITKPFAMAELLARIRAIHRRDALGTPDRVASGTVDLDLFHHHVKVNGAELPLSRTEFDVLRSLVMAEEAVVPRSQLLKEIWGTESYINPNVLD